MANKENIRFDDEIIVYEFSDEENDCSSNDKGTKYGIHEEPDRESETVSDRAREMEEELAKLKEIQSQVAEKIKMCTPPVLMSFREKMEMDDRSIYIGNVDYGASNEELEQHFQVCGSIKRVSILHNKYTHTPKGFAYMEFNDKRSAENALSLNGSIFRKRQIKVMSKRTNRPGISSTHRPPRGRGAFRGSKGINRGFYFGNISVTRERNSGRGRFNPYALKVNGCSKSNSNSFGIDVRTS